jgi:uracil-DNA glycosylase
VTSNASLQRLHRRIRACTRCVEAGLLPVAGPVLSGFPDNRIMLIGQAPGKVEEVRRRPFQGRSGKALMRWLVRAGFGSETEVRRQVYMTSVTKCFPGKGKTGGDRRPSPAEVELCRSHLDAELGLIRPEIILLVGGLSHKRFLPGRPLQQLVGQVFDLSGRRLPQRSRVRPVLVPLPHPSGASRWLNDPQNLALLERALRRLEALISPHLDGLIAPT